MDLNKFIFMLFILENWPNMVRSLLEEKS